MISNRFPRLTFLLVIFLASASFLSGSETVVSDEVRRLVNRAASEADSCSKSVPFLKPPMPSSRASSDVIKAIGLADNPAEMLLILETITKRSNFRFFYEYEIALAIEKINENPDIFLSDPDSAPKVIEFLDEALRKSQSSLKDRKSELAEIEEKLELVEKVAEGNAGAGEKIRFVAISRLAGGSSNPKLTRELLLKKKDKVEVEIEKLERSSRSCQESIEVGIALQSGSRGISENKNPKGMKGSTVSPEEGGSYQNLFE